MTADAVPRPGDARSRRELLAVTTLTAGAALAAIAGCGGDAPRDAPLPELPNPERDVATLAPVLEQEYAAIAAYGDAAEALHGDRRRLAARFREQERQHADRVARMIERLGGRPRAPQARRDYTIAFPRLAEADEALGFAADVEETAVGAYLSAITRLSTAAFRAEAATILAVEAEQLSALRLELGRPPVPEAFLGVEPPS